MKNVGFCGAIMLLSFVLLSSCADGAVDDGQAGHPVFCGDQVSFGVDFRVNPERVMRVMDAQGPEIQGGDRVHSFSIVDPGVSTDEGTAVGYVPRDVWVFQYAGAGDDALLAGLPRYLTLSGPVTIQAVASSVPNTLLFVANTHDPNIEWGNVNTLGHFKQISTTITQESDCYGSNYSLYKDLIMSGQYVGPISTGDISAELFRNIVRLDFTLSNAMSSAMTLKTIQLCNVPRNTYYAAGVMPRDMILPFATNYFNYPAQTIQGAASEGGSQLWTFYMPVNQQGVSPGSSSNKTKSNFAPGYASYIRILAENSQGETFVYKIHPGANMIDDYNLSANHRYQLGISINSQGDASTDGRVEDYGQVDFWSANSYILNPSPSGIRQRVFTFPITKVNQYWVDVDPTLIIRDGQAWTAELLWQDTPEGDFIRFIDLETGAESTVLHGSGPAQRIALTTKADYQGNALIGLKMQGREEVGYLWSWHLWVTDYNPAYKAPPVAGRYVYSVTGGAVHRYSGDPWDNPSTGRYYGKYIMDRNLGSRSANFGIVGSLLYQFGRKDPMPNNHSDNALYDIHGLPLLDTDPLNAATKFVDAKQGVTMATSILNPTYFYYKAQAIGLGDWSLEGKTGLFPWNHTVQGVELKSMFDPCPVGWKLPLNDVWNDFGYSANTPSLSTVLSEARDVKLGWSYGGTNGLRYWPRNLNVTGTIFYPAVGYRTAFRGLINGVAVEVDCWSSISPSTANGYYLIGHATSVARNNAARAYGLPVRCVQE